MLVCLFLHFVFLYGVALMWLDLRIVLLPCIWFICGCFIFLNLCGGLNMVSRIRLFVKVRSQGSRIESIPLKRLEKLSKRSKRKWYFENGWLVLETN
jgi:hypothetical protein